jgi:hypothetical protein
MLAKVSDRASENIFTYYPIIQNIDDLNAGMRTRSLRSIGQEPCRQSSNSSARSD